MPSHVGILWLLTLSLACPEPTDPEAKLSVHGMGAPDIGVHIVEWENGGLGSSESPSMLKRGSDRSIPLTLSSGVGETRATRFVSAPSSDDWLVR